MISLWTIPALPLMGAALCTLVHFMRIRRGFTPASEKWLGMAGSFFVLTAFGFSCGLAVSIFKTASPITFEAGNWISAGSFSIPFKLRLDQLSACLVLIITGIGSLIHLYSIEYMKGDRGFARYFACLNLFVASMLLLVLGDNLPLLFVGWEGVGLCSYLLIGFWYEKDGPPQAGQKAFVVNRIGDFGFLLGMFYLFSVSGTFDFTSINAAVQSGKITESAATIASLLLFAGAIGKSAQIPLYVWLPDAMAGPTPVSALIHAATMVTAGIYLVCRMSAVFALSSVALPVVAIVGTVTALFAASMALVEKDIKKVLAYSTVSQLGFMVLGAGAAGFHAAGFHLLTHAFFKALLFLGAGSVIHAMSGEQDIFKMGGLRKKLPITHITFFIGILALAGCPPLSGFVSKDEILWATVHHNTGLYWTLWGMASLTSFMTAFYSIRLYLLVFHGEPRYGHEVHPHESPFLMTFPLVVLSVFALFGGVMNLPEAIFHKEGWLAETIGPVFSAAWSTIAQRPAHESLNHEMEIVFIGISAALAILGMGIAWFFYARKESTAPKTMKESFPGLYKLWSAHYGIDELYQMLIVSPLRLFSISCSLFDLFVIDGMVNLAGSGAKSAGSVIRKIQSGHLQSYGVWLGVGAVAALLIAWIS